MSKAVFPEKPAVRPLEGSDYELAEDYYFRAKVDAGAEARQPENWEARQPENWEARQPENWEARQPEIGEARQPEIGGWDVVVHVRPGFRTDGASIPRLLWRVFGSPYDPDIFPAAIAHDAMYRGEIVERKDADRAFLAMMAAAGVSKRKRRLVYRGVRWFGWITWRGHTPESVAEARRRIELDFASYGAGRE